MAAHRSQWVFINRLPQGSGSRGPMDGFTPCLWTPAGTGSHFRFWTHASSFR